MSATPNIASFPRCSTESAAQSSDRLLKENAVGWVEHFVIHGDDETAEGLYRFVCRMKARLERERGFGKK